MSSFVAAVFFWLSVVNALRGHRRTAAAFFTLAVLTPPIAYLYR